MKYKLKPLKTVGYQMYYILLFILTDTWQGIGLTCSDYVSNVFRDWMAMFLGFFSEKRRTDLDTDLKDRMEGLFEEMWTYPVKCIGERRIGWAPAWSVDVLYTVVPN